MAMLVSLTSTALARQWPPPMYARLVLQLRDSADLGSDEAVLQVYERLLAEQPLNPLLMEYIAVLSSDQHAILWFPALLRRFAAQDWRGRPQKLRALVAYLARSSADWELPPEHEGLMDDLGASVRALLVQAADGSAESRLLVECLARGKLLAQLAELPGWLPSVEPYLHVLGQPLAAMPGRAATEPPRSAPSDEPFVAPLLVTPSRTMRLLWLEWLLRTSQPLAFACLKPQLDVVWAGDRVPTVSYELCVTAFDVYAARPDPYVMAFILRGLPVLLQDLASETPEVLDGVLARVLTTMDKEVAEAMDAHNPTIRADFCSTCIDMGLCDPTVLHALHRSHVPRHYPALSFDEFRKHWSMDDFVRVSPPTQAQLARETVLAAQGALSIHRPLDRHSLAMLCSALYRNHAAADQLFVHAPVRDFLNTIVQHADAASLQWEEDGGAGLVYNDLGIFLATAEMLARRYNLELPHDSWTREYIRGSLFSSVGQLSTEQSHLLGLWVKGLFSGSGSGIGDELLRPFRELAAVLPALLRQAVLAYRSAVIDRETLKGGLDYFVQPFSVALLAPLVFRVLSYDLFEGLHQANTLEIAVFYLTMVLQKSTPEIFVVKATIVNTIHKMRHEIRPNNTNIAAQKLGTAFVELANRLDAQVGALAFEDEEPAPESSLCEAVKKATTRLAEWQARPQGVPSLPVSVITFQAKAALGIDKVREIIDQAAASSPDTQLALLLADALWSRLAEQRLLDAPGDNRLTQSARDVSAKFEAISADWEAKHSQEISKLKEEVRNLPPLPSQPVDTVKEEPGTNSNQAAPVDAQAQQPEAEPVKLEAEPEMLIPSDMNYGEEFMDDFNADFVNSQPMNLADLDSAMDFGWD